MPLSFLPHRLIIMADTKDTREAIASYITDMLALEKHIEQAVAGQIEDLDEHPDVVRQLKSIHARCETHVAALERMAEQREGSGQSLAGAVKKAASAVLGVGAAGLDFIRAEKLPKNLRDDYTALSLASIGYVMLHTTASALDDDAVAELAKRHLDGYAGAVVALHNMIPGAVMAFLRDEGFAVHSERLEEISRATHRTWNEDESAHAKPLSV